ncbi:MAG: isoleucine--tRNA ligase, partial [Acidobacteriota bacterium]
CRTALAEAEVEYADHTSPSIYVEFPLGAESAARLAERVPELAGREVSVLIWTTTPWTIPSNLAIAFHPDFDYAAYHVDGRAIIVAEALATRVAEAVGRNFGSPLVQMKGAELEHLRFRHPLYARDSLGVLADYVTLEQGTGAVHTAPGHGSDDFLTGMKYGLEVYAPIGPAGHFLQTVELFGGQRVFDANPRVEEALKERGRLWHREAFQHTYPHCWRCHNPVIFLATSQWFIGMDGALAPLDGATVPTPGPAAQGAGSPADGKTLRQAALDAIDTDVRWVPEWGHDRIRNMLVNRPDWCISRQRAWGVPIPAVDCASCGDALLTPALVERAATVFDTYGADSWYERPIEEFIPEGLTCPACGGTEFERERDILDVWFDSGSSHEAVLPFRPELTWPADVYLEGGDQHRGWFQSSLLVGLGTRGRAPYRQVVTHGFIVAEDGRKMSKSLGNSIEPQDIIKESGAEIIRLWVVMVDYREEVRVGKQILARVVEAYRKIRNTLRYLASNLYDFDPSADLVPLGGMNEVDRFALARYGTAAATVLKAYEQYDFPAIFQAINQFATVDLSAFYADVSKDRLYTFAAASPERRSAQTAMYIIADGLTRLLAPVLPMTTDELWRHLPGTREASVHLAEFPQDVGALLDPALNARWERLMKIRDDVNRALEAERQAKTIGNSLGARVTVTSGGADAALLERYRDDLAMLFIVSRVDLETNAAEGAALEVKVARADGDKCPRCWRTVKSISSDLGREGLCDRCVDALHATGGRIAG